MFVGVSNLVLTGLFCVVVISFNYIYFFKCVLGGFHNLFAITDPNIFLKFFCGIDNTLFHFHYYSYMGDKHSMYGVGRVCCFYNKDYTLNYQPEVNQYLSYLSYNYYEYYQHYNLHMALHPMEPFISEDYSTIHEPSDLWFIHKGIKYNHY